MYRQGIKSFIENKIGVETELTLDTDLFVSGYVDSYDFLELISSIETKYNIKIDFSEIDPSDLTEVGELITACEQRMESKPELQSISSNEFKTGSKNIALVGNDRPMQQVLSNIEGFDGINFYVLYTDEDSDSEVVSLAESLEIDVRPTKDLNDSKLTLRDLPPDYILNVNSTVIFSEKLLSVPQEGCLNMHPGKLPEYAGLHTHQWALLNNENQFGATLHWMSPKIDAGPIAYRETFTIGEDDTGLQLFLKAIDTGTELTLKALKQISTGDKLPRESQDISKREVYKTKDIPDGEVNWDRSAQDIYNFVRAADYRPFNSPTYEPYIILDGQKVTIRAVQVLDQNEGEPGKILRLNETIVVGTNSRDVEVLEMELNSESLTGKEIKKNFDISSGAEI
jgi:methionyl-tRNA formyltransferase/acyl carrier protein